MESYPPLSEVLIRSDNLMHFWSIFVSLYVAMLKKDEIVKSFFASLILWCSQQFSFNSSAVIQNEIYFVSINSIIRFIRGIIN